MSADTNSPPQFPAGEWEMPIEFDGDQTEPLIVEMGRAPSIIRESIAGLSEEQLDAKYRNWTIRQIVHHLADSHVNMYIRTKWTLTEASPLIKAYNEGDWSDTDDAKTLPLDSSLQMLDGIHQRLANTFRKLDEDQMHRTYFHPQLAREVPLFELLSNYVWHTSHHTAQIRWVREQNSW